MSRLQEVYEPMFIKFDKLKRIKLDNLTVNELNKLSFEVSELETDMRTSLYLVETYKEFQLEDCFRLEDKLQEEFISENKKELREELSYAKHNCKMAERLIQKITKYRVCAKDFIHEIEGHMATLKVAIVA